MPRSTEVAILQALAFYELFSVGRTPDQLAPFVLDQPMEGTSVVKGLDQLAAKKALVRVGNQYGFNRTSAKRTSDAALSATKKHHIADRIARSMQPMLFIRMVAVTQSVAMETAKASSDVDMFTVTAPNRLWTARFFALAWLKLTGLAKQHGSTADHGCFGFWIDITALHLQPIAIDDDVYLAFWLAHLKPLMNRDATYQSLLASNANLLQRFPNWKPQVIDTNPTAWFTRSIEWVLGGYLGNWIEKFLYQVQAKKIWRDDIAHRQGASVIVNRHMCKLHHFDKRAELRDRWIALIKNDRPHTEDGRGQNSRSSRSAKADRHR